MSALGLKRTSGRFAPEVSPPICAPDPNQERNKYPACVRYRADLFPVIRVTPTGWRRSSITAPTPAFVFRVTQPMKRYRAITTAMSR